MHDKVVRGQSLSHPTLENGIYVPPVGRVSVAFRCAAGHESTVDFWDEATPPVRWECTCGQVALQVGADASGAPPGPEPAPKPRRTHYDMLLERRSVPELEDLLVERLTLLRAAGTLTGQLDDVAQPRSA